jgi:1-deoxy-D-xylulose-5-phosphate synthase
MGTWEVLREGADAAILAVGSMVYPALNAAQLLSQKSVEVSVINCRFVKPLDDTILMEAAESHPLLVTVEENVLAGGFGAAVLEFLEHEGKWGTRICRMGLPDRFIEHGARNELLSGLSLDAQGICSRVLKELKI